LLHSTAMKKERLDTLVQRQANVSRSKAQGLIHTGHVYLPDGTRAEKPGIRLDPDTALDIKEGARFVSRGGEKLEGALRDFGVDVSGVTAIDVGASTGGFTDCLLQHGATKVFAVDVGYGQLAWELREDPRVTVLERTNIRKLKRESLDVPPDFFVADCSFISLSLVLPPLADLLQTDARGLVLIKPQFEAGKHQVGKGGVVRDEAVREMVVKRVLDEAAEMGYERVGVKPSVLKGPAGNQEFFAYLRYNGHA